MKRKLNPEDVAKTWIYRGTSHLYFAFCVDDYSFRTHASFHEIMGMEMFIKALYLFHERARYEGQGQQKVRATTDKLARNLGHNFEKMIEFLGVAVSKQSVKRLLGMDFDGYSGKQMLETAQLGYEESRYPVQNPVHMLHRIPGKEKRWRDPMGSTGITKFAYATCSVCMSKLSSSLDLEDLFDHWDKVYGDRNSYQRFCNLFWINSCGYTYEECGVGAPMN